MFKRLSRIFRDWSDLRRFSNLPESQRTIVFYSEGRHDWPHFKPIILSLLERTNVTYVSSDQNDPAHVLNHPKFLSFSIGYGTARTVFFRGLSSKLLVSSLPELDKFNLKRSVHPVHYVYAFHSINSAHMVYREGSFEAYDSILCVGPHHQLELKKLQESLGGRLQEYVAHGACRMDSLLEEYEERRINYQPPSDSKLNILVAPSWGVGSLIEDKIGPEILRLLLEGGHRIKLRLHPMTVRHYPQLTMKLRRFFEAFSNFEIEDDVSCEASFHEADVMVTDWSGAGTEFAFGLERPVLYIDTAPKVNNTSYSKLEIIPLEVAIRTEIGMVLHTDKIDEINSSINCLIQNLPAVKKKIIAARTKWIFNIGESGKVGADFIYSKAYS